MKLKNLTADINFASIAGNSDIDIAGISYNSNNIKNNFIFVALKGLNFDGNNYIPQAIANGAVAIITDKEISNSEMLPNITYLVANDARLTLAQISHKFYDNPADKLTIIGITGTNGKTTTAFLVKSILENARKNTALIGTTGIYFGNKMLETTHTTPESLELALLFRQMIDNGVTHCVMEVSSHSIAMQRVAYIPFKVAAFTNLTHEHLDFHKTMKDYAATKQQLFNTLSKNSTAVVNYDDGYAQLMIEKSIAKKILLTSSTKGDILIQDIKFDMQSSQFNLVINNKKTDSFSEKTLPITTRLTAQYNIQNAALAASICIALENIPVTSIINGLKSSDGAPGRLEKITLSNGAVAFVDYAHTPDALEKALLACKSLLTNSQQILICVFGCGGDRDKSKRAIMGKIAENIANTVIITDDNPRTEASQAIISEILQGISNANNIHIIPNRSEAIKFAVATSKNDDIILVAGKGHENYQIIGKEKYHFSDQEELLKIK